LSAVW